MAIDMAHGRKPIAGGQAWGWPWRSSQPSKKGFALRRIHDSSPIKTWGCESLNPLSILSHFWICYNMFVSSTPSTPSHPAPNVLRGATSTSSTSRSSGSASICDRRYASSASRRGYSQMGVEAMPRSKPRLSSPWRPLPMDPSDMTWPWLCPPMEDLGEGYGGYAERSERGASIALPYEVIQSFQENNYTVILR